MSSEEQILLKQMDVDGEPQQDKLIHNLRFIRIAKMLRKRLPEGSLFNLGNLIDIILSDPTTHIRKDQLLPGKYSEWIAKQYLLDLREGTPERFWEDLEKMSADLGKFHDLKTRGKIPEEKRDISHIENREDLYDLIEIKENKIVLNGFPDFRHLTENMDAVLIHASESANVYALVSHEASRQIGAGTRWCTVPGYQTFHSYSKKSFLYVIFIKRKQNRETIIDKYQVHFSTSQFMDVNDRMHGMDGILSGELKKDMIRFAAEENDPFALLYFDEFDKISLSHFRKLAENAVFNRYGYGTSAKMNQKAEALITSNHGRSMIASLSPHEIDNLFFKNPALIEKVSSPTKQMKIAAIKGNAQYMSRFKELSSEESVIEDIVRKNSNVLSYIPKPSRALQILAVDLGFFNLLKNPLPEIRIKAVEKSWKNLQYIKGQTSEEIKIAMNQNIDAIQFVENPSNRMQVNVVKKKASLIQYFQIPCHEAQMLAVEQDFTLIGNIKRASAVAMQRASVLRKEAEKNVKMGLAQTNEKRRWKNLPPEERIELMRTRLRNQ